MSLQVAFYKGRTHLFDRAVQWWLRGPYSHCELVLWTNPEGLSFCISSSYRDGGVRSKWIALEPAHWHLVPVHGSVAAAIEWEHDHSDDGYDVLGLVGFVWRSIAGEQRKWFCSEAVAAMLGYPDPWRFDPMALWAALMARNKATPKPQEPAPHA